MAEAILSSSASSSSPKFPAGLRLYDYNSDSDSDSDDARDLASADDCGAKRCTQKKAKLKLQRGVKKQLEYMDDPWKIGQYVEQALAKDRYDEALLLTQTASKNLQVVVSWNHLINYMLQKQQLRNAVKLYNDMKKRAQLPNLQTYTIMFRGFSKSQHPKLAVSEAVKHYHKLLKDSRLEPNSIHLNAVLNVCNRAGDLDSMFAIADTINDSTRSPTAYTYTTIINALRFNAMADIKDTQDLPTEQRAANLENAIRRGKAVWEEAMSKWRKGRLVIDEEMVCAMGRLMLLAPRNSDKREVLDLLEQTMNIPNLHSPTGKSINFQRPVDSNDAQVARKDDDGSYVTPGRNTLALVLTILASARLRAVGIKYWNLLVREFKIVPDLDAWMRLQGLLKVSKASLYATSILPIIPDEYINPRFYRMAMEACVRNNINQSVIKDANRALDSMMERLELPDPHALRLYLRVAQVSHYHLRRRSQAGNDSAARREYGLQITEALARLWEPYLKLQNHFFNEVEAKTESEKKILYNDKREVIALARIMYSSFNMVIQQKMIPEDDLKEIRPIGGRINREIHNFYSNREEHEPKLRHNRNRGGAPEDDMSEYNEGGPDHGFIWDTTRPVNFGPKPEKDLQEGDLERHPNDHRRRRSGSLVYGSPHKRKEGLVMENQEDDLGLPPYDRRRRARPVSGDPLQRRAAIQW
ncbi:hypothetical protein ACJ41O_011386 [Fusarium nematophilum]